MSLYEPNPYQKRLDEIIQKSRSLGAEAGDLVELNHEQVYPCYREKKKGEPYEMMIERYTSLGSPYCQFVVLSCSGVQRFRDCVGKIIVKGFQLPHPCYQYPCANTPTQRGKREAI